jgi:hypothetical protein
MMKPAAQTRAHVPGPGAAERPLGGRGSFVDEEVDAGLASLRRHWQRFHFCDE